MGRQSAAGPPLTAMRSTRRNFLVDQDAVFPIFVDRAGCFDVEDNARFVQPFQVDPGPRIASHAEDFALRARGKFPLACPWLYDDRQWPPRAVPELDR